MRATMLPPPPARALALALAFVLASVVAAHGGNHGQKPMVDKDANWMTKHMAGMSHHPAPPLPSRR
ncbi:hypothetical protein OCS_01353 [Ophiocordyceps sinensis CO18]|uniref:Uncharacterized protein n=1 Tax=Ophiocordyceps sinensis (strain Co18 / CGMCC 3.14243) TaxID=911162 RepID=T5AME9_OPHSC|nr:hypothetical protein OCS_01353 [Ophiocordyceps sinensis CO18]